MKLSLITLSLACSLACSLANAEMYKVYIKRDDSNLYIDKTNNIVIKTKYCYEYTYGEDAILIYEKGSYSNKLIFKNGESCDVDWVSSL